MVGTRKSVNKHYGKIVRYHTAGVELELIIVEFPVENAPGVAKCIDRTGAKYRVLARRLKGTQQKASGEEITQICAASYARCQKRANERRAQNATVDFQQYDAV